MPLSDNRRGALLMTAGMAAFTGGDACMKALAPHLPLFQAIFLRGLGISVLVWGAVLWQGRPAVPPRAWRLMGLRTFCEAGAAWFYLSALSLLPIADVAAIHQAVPLTVTLAAAVVLREQVGGARILAILGGLAGVLLMIRPEGEGGWATLLVLGSVACVTARDLLSRAMPASVPSLLVAAVAAAGVTALAGGGAVFVDWRPVAGGTALLLAATVAFTLAGYVATVGAMRAGEVSFVAPFRYTSLLCAVALGAVVFGTWPDALTLVGGAIVVAAGLVTILGARPRPSRAVEAAAPGA